MRIALFTDTYLPQVNGVTRTLGRLVEHASERGFEVALVTPRVSETDAAHTSLHVQLPALGLFFYPEVRLARPLGPYESRRLRAFDPDVVHCAVEGPVGWAGRWWAARHGVPFVTSFHTNFPAYLSRYRMGWLRGGSWMFLRTFHRRALRTFCPSRDTIALLRDHGFRHPLRLWPRGVDAERFSPRHRSTASRLALAPGAERILVYVGRLAPEKRLDVLREAWPRIREGAPVRTALLIVGDGPASDELRRWAGEDVYFTGYLSGEPLARAYAAGDVFVFPSDTETFGNVVTEAMASGVPVVGVRAGGVADTVRDGRNGRLVSPGDAAGFADAVLELLNDEALRVRCAEEALRDARQLSWEAILDDLLEEYREVGAPPDSPIPV